MLSPSWWRAAIVLRQAAADGRGAAPACWQSFAPQCGEICGVLRQFVAAFQARLSDLRKDEMANHKAYGDLEAAEEQAKGREVSIDKEVCEELPVQPMTVLPVGARPKQAASVTAIRGQC